MTDRSIEAVSALMDAEVADFELRRTLDKLSEDPEAAQRWRRYHLARSAMHEEVISDVQIDISGSVMAALEDEAPLSAGMEHDQTASQPVSEDVPGKSRISEMLWKPLTSMAVAASVTAVVILGVQNFDQNGAAPAIADSRPDYVLPQSAVQTGNYVRAQLGSRTALPEPHSLNEPEIIRLSQGLSRYINQHKHMLSAQKPQWKADWLPNGFVNVRHEVLPDAEVMVFSNGRNSFSVCIERLGRQSVPQGVAQSDKMVAVAKRKNQHFVTVIGDVPLMIAEQIASSVSPERL